MFVDTAVAAGRCLETSELLALVDGECDDATRRIALVHAAACESCRQAIAGIAKAVRSDLDALSQPAIVEQHPPEALGRYRVQRVIGRGAMGTVYEAFDPLLHRRVAIKRIHGSAGQRLRREAQVLARLADPHVVAVLEVGPDWLAMELVEGETLARWQRGQPWREIVAAYQQAARGLAAAHALGIVHRDFKPSNVLRDAGGRVRVADFGLAIGDADEVGQGDLVGTPAYMAPEQFLGRVADAKSDQFAFCVALFEALAGERPFAGDDVTALAAAVLAGRMRSRPRTSVPRPIWRVIERGLENEPDARWPAMHALADALARAQPRRLVPVVAAAASLAAIATLSIDRTSCAQTDPGWTPERARTMTEGVIGSGLEYARATADGVTHRLDAWSERWIDTRVELCQSVDAIACLDDQLAARDELVRVLATGDRAAVLGAVRAAQRLPDPPTCATRAPQPERSPEARALARELLAERAALLLHTDDDDLPRLERAVARAEAIGDAMTIAEAHAVLASAQAVRGRWELAMPMLEDAYFRSYEVGDDTTASELARNLALGASWQGHHDEALRWARLARARAVDDAQRAEAATTEADELYALGHPDLAEAALAIALVDEAPSFARASALTILAAMRSGQGQPELAEAPLLEAIAAIEHEAGTQHPDLSRPLNLLGVVQIQLGRLHEAQATLERARDLVIAQLGEHHPLVAFVLGNLAIVQGKLGDREGAYQSLEQVLAIFERDPASDPDRILRTLHNLALEAIAAGRPAVALRHCERALAMSRDRGDEQEIIRSLEYLARAQRGAGDPHSAMASWDELIALRHAITRDDDDELGWAELEAAITAIDAGWAAEAEPHIERALVHYARSTKTSAKERARAEGVAARVRAAQ
jgi:eukaryotic-like serine/threonine-protein kinase